jgi:uncharacterized delta-60 repeat protein
MTRSWWQRARQRRRYGRPDTGRVPVRLHAEQLEDRRVLSAVVLDPTFGNGSYAAVPGLTNAADAVVQPDGKIVVAGNTLVRFQGDVIMGSFTLPDKFAVTRFNPDGGLDTTFGTGGQVLAGFGSDQSSGTLGDVANGVALQPDGKIVVAGSVPRPATSAHDFVLIRFNADGSLDTGFGTGGLVTVSPAGWGGGAVAVQPDGKIVTLGSGFTVMRFDATGQPDSGFGTGGSVTTTFAGLSLVSAMDVALQPDGKIVAAGGGGSYFGAARYDAAGRLDPSFGSGGPVAVNLAVHSGPIRLALQSDGKVVLAGTRNGTSGGFSTDFVVARFNADGSLDAGFGSGGMVVTDLDKLDSLFGLGLQPDGKIVAAGTTASDYHTGPAPSDNFAVNLRMALARYDPDGSPDATFGSHGQATPTFVGGGNAVLAQPDGKLLLAGDGAVIRLLAAAPIGPPDVRFVEQVYEDVLGRSADAAGLATWTGLLHTGGTYAQVAAGVLGSAESQARVVADVYTRFLNRAPDPSGLAGGVAFLAAGGTLGRLEANGGGSEEFYRTRAQGADIGFLTVLYSTGLKRDLDPAGEATFGQLLAQGMSRTEVAQIVLGSQEAHGVVVSDYYRQFLARQAQLGEMQGWVAALNHGVRPEQVAAAIQNSPEYLAPLLTDPANAVFVRHVYSGLLGREADAAGLAHFTALLDRGDATPFHVVAMLQASPEYRTHVVQGIYTELLDRAADPSGVNSGVAALAAGMTAEQLRAAVLGSAEYFAERGAGTDPGFVAALYRDVLGRAPDSSGQMHALMSLAGGTSRRDVAAAVLASAEAHTREVQEAYQRYLGRDADSGGLDVFTQALQHGMTEDQVVRLLLASGEYFARRA